VAILAALYARNSGRQDQFPSEEDESINTHLLEVGHHAKGAGWYYCFIFGAEGRYELWTLMRTTGRVRCADLVTMSRRY